MCQLTILYLQHLSIVSNQPEEQRRSEAVAITFLSLTYSLCFAGRFDQLQAAGGLRKDCCMAAQMLIGVGVWDCLFSPATTTPWHNLWSW